MTGGRSSRRRARRDRPPSGARPDPQPPGRPTPPPAPAARGGGTSKLVLAFALLLGLFLGRVLSEQLAPGLLRLADLAMYALLAGVIALSFRAWARRRVELRRREQLRRRRRPGTPREQEDAP